MPTAIMEMPVAVFTIKESKCGLVIARQLFEPLCRFLARSGGRGMSALAPLLRVKRTSASLLIYEYTPQAEQSPAITWAPCTASPALATRSTHESREGLPMSLRL
jgi:hypothetical protein